MSNYSLKLNKLQVQILKTFYKKQLKKSNNKNISFFVDVFDAKITIYNNNTLLVQGKDALSIFSFVTKFLQSKTNIDKLSTTLTNQTSILRDFFSLETPKTQIKQQLHSVIESESIGCDEVGTGDVFGPVVICCVYLSQQNISFLQKIGSIVESKKMSDAQIFKVTPVIIEKILYSSVLMVPLEYNKIIKKCNLNKIKALMHNKAIQQTVNKASSNVVVILDQFCAPENYFDYLKDESTVYQKITFKTQADSSYLSVAVASIIARYFFLLEISKLSQQVGLQLKLGASKIVDQQISLIIRQHGLGLLQNIAKCNFKNIVRQINKY